MTNEINLREAVNAISDVVQNRPSPIRDFDQIYMRAGDMVLQSEFVASWARDKSLAFVGDGDAIGASVAYLHARGILEYGPAAIAVFDFDERIVSAVRSFAEKKAIANLSAHLYNCLDPVPEPGAFDFFYSNPPWGKTNRGKSVSVFAQRGMEFVGNRGEGLLVVADRVADRPWTEEVLRNVQAFVLERDFYITRMMPNLHSYHLDDDPDLRSCNLILRSGPSNTQILTSSAITEQERLEDFYKAGGGRPIVRYIRDHRKREVGHVPEDEYEFEYFDTGDIDD